MRVLSHIFYFKKNNKNLNSKLLFYFYYYFVILVFSLLNYELFIVFLFEQFETNKKKKIELE